MRCKIAWVFLLGFWAYSTGCSKDYITGKSSYNWFKPQNDVSLGNQVLEAQTKAFDKKQVAMDEKADSQAYQRLQIIVKKITQVSHVPDFPYEVHLAEVPVVNAWAAPGGKIMVYTGLWDPKKGLVNYESDDEIAAVLSHEIAHATARHVTETLSTNLTIMLAGQVTYSAIALGGAPMGADLFSQVFSTGFNIFAPSYSRKNEAEADRIGLFYMAKAGYDPIAAVTVWKRAAQKRGDAASIYASHPANGDRARQLEILLPEAKKMYQDPSLPYPSFKAPKTVKKQAKIEAKAKSKGSSSRASPETQPSSVPSNPDLERHYKN